MVKMWIGILAVVGNLYVGAHPYLTTNAVDRCWVLFERDEYQVVKALQYAQPCYSGAPSGARKSRITSCLSRRPLSPPLLF